MRCWVTILTRYGKQGQAVRARTGKENQRPEKQLKGVQTLKNRKGDSREKKWETNQTKTT